MDKEIEVLIGDLTKRIERLEQSVHGVGPSQPKGCVCPVGAEFGCKNTGCPRQGLRLGTVTG